VARDSREQGARAERIAREYLEQRGMTTRELNYSCRMGEIDAVMQDGAALVFVEVRYRRTSRYGTPAETIDRKKQQRLLRAAEHYLQRSGLSDEVECRFDVVILEGALSDPQVQWISDAFSA